jgi:hypothetical protein
MRRGDCLDSLRIVSPCDVPWSSMEGDEAVRFCGKCRKNVYNVAQLPRAEAVALIERAEGRVCMQLTRRSDGTIVTGDCWAQLRRARKRGLFALALAAPAIFAATLWSQAFGLRALFGWFDRRDPNRLHYDYDEGGQARLAKPRPPLVRGEPIAIDLPPPAKDKHVLRGKIRVDAPLRTLGRASHPNPDAARRR